jgi:hypothetical protein
VCLRYGVARIPRRPLLLLHRTEPHLTEPIAHRIVRYSDNELWGLDGLVDICRRYGARDCVSHRDQHTAGCFFDTLGSSEKGLTAHSANESPQGHVPGT